MTREQLDLIPDGLLRPRKDGLRELIEWLYARGWQLSLADLDAERTRRGIEHPARPGRRL